MGYDFAPSNESAGDFHVGAFCWPWMLDAGVGLVICTGKGFTPGSFVYAERPDGLSVNYNDGAAVTAEEARDMARVARWVADYQDTLRSVYEREPEAKRREMENAPILSGPRYNIPVRRDFVEKLREFADWAEKSGGFRVY